MKQTVSLEFVLHVVEVASRTHGVLLVVILYNVCQE